MLGFNAKMHIVTICIVIKIKMQKLLYIKLLNMHTYINLMQKLQYFGNP